MKPNEYQRAAMRTENTPAFLDAAVVHNASSRGRLTHAALGLCTETGELQDALKRELIYGKPLDETNIVEECGDLLWYIALALDSVGATMEKAMEANIAKLRLRFPDGFKGHDALNRDLNAERAALEESVKEPVVTEPSPEGTDSKYATPEGMVTVSGAYVDYAHPSAASIHPIDIAVSLSQSARFCGQTNGVCNTAAHSIVVSEVLRQMGEEQLALVALLHDAPEAYMGDVPYPLILATGEGLERSIRSKIKRKLELAIAKRFCFDAALFNDEALHRVDRIVPYFESEIFHPVQKLTPLPGTDDVLEILTANDKYRDIYLMSGTNAAKMWISLVEIRRF